MHSSIALPSPFVEVWRSSIVEMEAFGVDELGEDWLLVMEVVQPKPRSMSLH